MQADWLFWAIAAVLVIGCLGTVFAPLLLGAGRADRRASYDIRVHRDQLREIDADLARGVLSAPEAAATRIEVSRRLLSAADAEAAESDATTAPRRLTRRLAPAMLALMLAATIGLYGWLGGGGLPDQPLDQRLAEAAKLRADRPGQAEAEAMVASQAAPAQPAATPQDLSLLERLQQTLANRPDDLDGHRLLAKSLAALQRWQEARAAQERVVEILGEKATASDLVDLAEIRILAAGGYVSPEAEETLSRALKLAPNDPAGRYYSALTLLQGGRPDLAYRIWSGLIDEGPADAPWMAPARAGRAEAARLAGLPPPDPAPADATPAAPAPAGPAPAGPAATGPGPTAADIDAAAQMTPADRQAMIQGMVGQLSDRLATQGGPPEDWAKLIRSLGVLGAHDEAAAILAEARTKHAGDPTALAEIEAAGRDAGLASMPPP